MAVKQDIEQNKAVALRFANEGWGTQENWRAVWDEVVAFDVVYHFNSAPEAVVGLDDNKAFNATLFAGFPDIEHAIEAIVAEGDKVIYRTRLRGRHTGDFLGMSPTGKVVQLSDFTMLKIVDGKIVEWWYDCNLLALMQQLGLAPSA